MIRLVGSPLAIPESHARLCTRRMEMDAYRKGANAHVKHRNN